jgi:glycine/D-amino acid oxidase-like deaminating enzyme
VAIYDIVVIGGGAVGLSLAYLGASQGYRVAVVESRHLCSGATGRSAGIVTVQLSLPEDVAMAKRTIEVFREVSEVAGIPFHKETGFLTVLPERTLEESLEPLRADGTAYRVLKSDEVERYVPFLKVYDHEVGILTFDDMTVDASEMGRAFSEVLSGMGVDLYQWNGRTVISLDGTRIRRVSVNGGTELRGESYVLAAGPWNKVVLREIGIRASFLTIYKCQVVRVRADGIGEYVPFYTMGEHLYMRPDVGGTSIAGNGYAKVVEFPEDAMDGLEKEYVQHIAELLAERVFNPEDFRVEGGWSGPCSITPDGYPVIGRIPGLENAYLVDGLDGYGLMRAAGIAELALKAVEGEEQMKYSPARFNGEELSGEVVELHSV